MSSRYRIRHLTRYTYADTIPCAADFLAYARPVFTPGRPVLEAALDLNRRIHHDPGKRSRRNRRH